MRSAALLGLLCLASLAAAPATRPATPLSRLDLAEAYRLVERTLEAHPPADRAAVHRAFDAASLEFFRGRGVDALRRLHDLADALRPEPRRGGWARTLDAVRVRVAPPVASRANPSPLRIQLSWHYPMPDAAPIELRVRASADRVDATPLFEAPITLVPGGPPVTLARMQPPEAGVGRYRLDLVAPDGASRAAARWFVASSSLDEFRELNAQRLMVLRALGPAFASAVLTAEARNALIGDRPGETDSVRFLGDPVELAALVHAETDLLEARQDPYRQRVGEVWRVVVAGAMRIPTVVHAPPHTQRGEPLPLVIALHGAGGDEMMFLHGYGNGRLRRLADERGFLVACPSAYWVIPNPRALPAIIDAVAANHPVDLQRVYVLGHSLGGMPAAAWAREHRDRVAAACVVAGAPPLPPDAETCPLLLVAGALDPIVPAERVQASIAAARDAGRDVHLRVLPDAGHTLIVGEALPEILDWLFAHARPLDPAAP